MTRRDGTVQLSKRLQALADMVPCGKRVADVGCDHGFLDIYLVQSKKAGSALAMDVREGPLAAAARHISDAGLNGMIETRLSDGLKEFRAGEAEILICAGMGGPLMRRILTDAPEKTESFQELILQPQSELKEFRVFLREKGYLVTEERIIFEDGKYYFPMRVSGGRLRGEAPNKDGGEAGEEGMLIASAAEEREIYDRFGKFLIQRKEPLLLEYLFWQQRILDGILDSLPASGNEEDRGLRRRREVEQEAEIVREAIALMK